LTRQWIGVDNLRVESPNPELYLIDAIGPFFRGYEQRTINWSKIPWNHVRTQLEGSEADGWVEALWKDFETLCKQAAEWGFNAISLDDVTHLAEHPLHDEGTGDLVRRYQTLLRPCMEIAQRHGLQVYLTMDVFSASPSLRKRVGQRPVEVFAFLAELMDGFLGAFPEVAGVVLRIGESDGKDVRDDFHSELVIKHPREARQLLEALLPIFERHDRRLIFRTWTVGAYRIGDLMWNHRTFDEVFKELTSPALILSMKYGESDFFRFLPLSRHFFRTPLPKIVELQSKREYEGCGEYPSFVGWEYDRFIRELRHADNLIGCMVWCQTGGWVPFRRLAFLDEAAVWTDLNTFTTIRLMKEGWIVERAVEAFARERQLGDPMALLQLLRLSDEVIRELLYVEEFARQKLFFRRVRIPPLLQVYWGNIFISHSIKKVISYFVRDPEASLRSAMRCLERLEEMKMLAGRAGVAVADIEFMADTFHLLALAREYCLTPFTPEMEGRIRQAKLAYKAKYPKKGLRARYRVKTDFQPLLFKRRYLGWAIQLLMRRKRGYRFIDRILILHVLSLIYRVIAHRRPQWIPKFARDSAMGVDVVFR
jgi:hypothetical protein